MTNTILILKIVATSFATVQLSQWPHTSWQNCSIENRLNIIVEGVQ